MYEKIQHLKDKNKAQAKTVKKLREKKGYDDQIYNL